MRILLPILIMASFGLAQTPSPGGAEKKTSRLEGTVVGSTGEAIPRATLQLQTGQSPDTRKAIGGDDGRFVFEGVSPGLYTLSATKDGFLPQRYGAPVPTTSSQLNPPVGILLNLAGGEELKGLSIQMTRQSVVSGRVSNREGEPVVGARVEVLRYQYRNARRELSSVALQNTNDVGEFRIASLGPGRYYLVATHTEQPGPADEETNITTFYPSARDAVAAAPVDVAAGTEARGIEIRLQKARTYSIRGKAVGPGLGQERGRLRLRIEPYDSPDWRNDQVFVNTNGEFEFRNLFPGRYLLSTPLAGVSSNLTGRMEVTVLNSDVNNMVMEVAPRSRVTGRVEMEDGARARASRIVLAIGGSGWGSQLKEDGTFEVTNLQPGKYYVQVFGLGDDTYVKSVEFNGQQLAHQAVDAGSGGTMCIVLSAAAAHVAGRVQDEGGKAMAGVTVSVWPKTPDPGRINGGAQRTNTDQNGRFRLTGLPPGEYLIAAWEELEQGLAESSEFLALFSSSAKTITLQESAREELQLQPVPRKKIVDEIAKLP